WPDGPVDQPTGEDFLGSWPAFALDEATGKLAGRVSLLPVVDDQGKEVASLIRFAFDGGDQGDCIPIGDDDRPMCLLGPPAGFDAEFLGAEIDFQTTCLHGTYLACTGRK